MIGTTVDGGIGPNTLKAVYAFVENEGLEYAIDTYQSNRQAYYEKLSTFDTFGKGWTRRVVETTSSAHKLVKNS
jgi:lysozyme family protein